MRQSQALTIMMNGSNVFLTGAPGAGKTFVLNQFITQSKQLGKRVAVTASTGIAASHLGGNTIHSWSGLGILDELSRDDLKRLGASDKLKKRYRMCDILVIDEVSMLHGHRLDMVNQLAKQLRENDEPFGGLQVILVGDLFQLPPITRGSETVDFVHESHSWKELRLSICYLNEQHRQDNNDGLLIFLEAMRDESLDDDHYEIIKDRVSMVPDSSIVVTRLYSHNVDVDTINEEHLMELPGRLRSYEMRSKGSKAKIEQLGKTLLVPDILQLKIGAEVMFVANNMAEGFANGTRGKIIGFDNDLPIVQTLHGKKITVEENTWSLSEDGKIRAEITQLPLRLAWAITIHKSQGMSLDGAEIDLSRSFTPGMGYVALSRVRSLDGLYIKGINNMAFRLNPHIHSFDKTLRQFSAQLAAITDDFVPEEQNENEPETIVDIDSELLSKLKSWRISRSARDKVPAYIIAHNITLDSMARFKEEPTEQQLLEIPGVSIRKLEKYGPEIREIISSHYSNQ